MFLGNIWLDSKSDSAQEISHGAHPSSHLEGEASEEKKSLKQAIASDGAGTVGWAGRY